MQNRDLYFLLYSVSGNHNSRNPVALSIPNDEARQWMLDVPRNEVACLDVETTGLYPHQTDEVLQISICDGNGKMLLNTYVHPARRKRWPNAQSIHGITPAMVKDAPTLLDLSEEIYRILDNCTLLIGYNIRGFDLEFLKAGGVKLPYGMKVYDLINDCSVLYSYWNKKYGNYTFISLEKVAKKLGVTYSPHDSSEDVQATVKVYYKLLDSVKMKDVVKNQKSTEQVLKEADKTLKEIDRVLAVERGQRTAQTKSIKTTKTTEPTELTDAEYQRIGCVVLVIAGIILLLLLLLIVAIL